MGARFLYGVQSLSLSPYYIPPQNKCLSLSLSPRHPRRGKRLVDRRRQLEREMAGWPLCVFARLIIFGFPCARARIIFEIGVVSAAPMIILVFRSLCGSLFAGFSAHEYNFCNCGIRYIHCQFILISELFSKNHSGLFSNVLFA